MVVEWLVGAAGGWILELRLLRELAWRFQDKERLRVFLILIVLIIRNSTRNVLSSKLILHIIVFLVIANHRRDFRLLHPDKLLRSLLAIAMAQLIMRVVAHLVMVLILKMLLMGVEGGLLRL